MKKLKRFSQKFSESLERDVNKWLEQHGDEIRILNISYISHRDFLLCLILYKE